MPRLFFQPVPRLSPILGCIRGYMGAGLLREAYVRAMVFSSAHVCLSFRGRFVCVAVSVCGFVCACARAVSVSVHTPSCSLPDGVSRVSLYIGPICVSMYVTVRTPHPIFCGRGSCPCLSVCRSYRLYLSLCRGCSLCLLSLSLCAAPRGRGLRERDRPGGRGG